MFSLIQIDSLRWCHGSPATKHLRIRQLVRPLVGFMSGWWVALNRCLCRREPISCRSLTEMGQWGWTAVLCVQWAFPTWSLYSRMPGRSVERKTKEHPLKGAHSWFRDKPGRSSENDLSIGRLGACSFLKWRQKPLPSVVLNAWPPSSYFSSYCNPGLQKLFLSLSGIH